MSFRQRLSWSITRERSQSGPVLVLKESVQSQSVRGYGGKIPIPSVTNLRGNLSHATWGQQNTGYPSVPTWPQSTNHILEIFHRGTADQGLVNIYNKFHQVKLIRDSAIGNTNRGVSVCAADLGCMYQFCQVMPHNSINIANVKMLGMITLENAYNFTLLNYKNNCGN